MPTNINAATDFRGTFRQGDTITVHLKITTFDGTAIDPYQITTTITGPTEDVSGGDQTSTGTPYKADTGFYVYEWEIDADQAVGTYLISWEYIVDGEEKTELQNVVVTEDLTPPAFYTGRMVAWRDALGYHLSCAQSIPVYNEQARPSYDDKTFNFSFKNWNTSAGSRVYRNGKIINTGLEINPINGTVIFDEELLPQEQINVDYNFKWFDDDALHRFLENAVQAVNIYPPHSDYNLENVPSRYVPMILYGAAKDALRQLMMCLQFQQPAQIFGGPKEAQNAFKAFDTLKQNYEKDWEKLTEQKKLGPYPSTMTIITPEYTLPGGRSRWFRMLFKS